MDVMILEKTTRDGEKAFGLACGKKSAFITVSDLCIRVVNNNALFTTYKNPRTFYSPEDALNGYKSREMKEMISFALNA